MNAGLRETVSCSSLGKKKNTNIPIIDKSKRHLLLTEIKQIGGGM